MANSKSMSETIARNQRPSLIEEDSFPIEFLSVVAERESWRKEIHRPVYHIHKWWAKRLGSVFRGILLGCLLREDEDFENAFYGIHRFSEVLVFDPFMGSGTTVGEAHKLGCTALGRDINPVACESVRIAFGSLDRHEIKSAFSHLADTVGRRLRELYRSADENGELCDALYYFWVKQIPCPNCACGVDLFSTRVIASNAYPERKPEVQVCCPRCGDIFRALNSDTLTCCTSCALEFNPHVGSVRRSEATCPACSRIFSIAKAARASESPPSHRLYGKLLLSREGKKYYRAVTPIDLQSYRACSTLLKHETECGAIRLPEGVLQDGFNTRQAIGYNYRNWRDFFNDRQLLALGWLQTAIAELADVSSREALLALFSGLLEFNNLFTSYKGEGTGAVRHMFSHHILKPERTPIEANVWGTHKSSGSFSSLFRTRLLRALDYRAAPFEVTINDSGKVFHASAPFSGHVDVSWPVDGKVEPRGIYLSCGSSDETNLPDRCVDLVITDPPFFDNVHYSELADFFYSWQSLYPRGFLTSAPTTRNAREVQDTNAGRFTSKLRAVFSECLRLLKDDGLLVFTYHHSRHEGWTALLEAVVSAGFSIVNAHPIKAEMSVAAPKSQAKEPIQLDIVLVCRPSGQDSRTPGEPAELVVTAAARAREKLTRLRGIGLVLSLNDCRITTISQFVSSLGPVTSSEAAVGALLTQQSQLEEAAQRAFDTISLLKSSTACLATSPPQQTILRY